MLKIPYDRGSITRVVKIPIHLGWNLAGTVATSTVPTHVCDSLEAIIAGVKAEAAPGTQIVVMSNGGFGGLHGKLAEALIEPAA